MLVCCQRHVQNIQRKETLFYSKHILCGDELDQVCDKHAEPTYHEAEYLDHAKNVLTFIDEQINGGNVALSTGYNYIVMRMLGHSFREISELRNANLNSVMCSFFRAKQHLLSYHPTPMTETYYV